MNSSHPTLELAFSQGLTDALLGVPAFRNPYRAGSRYAAAWDEGWRAAHREPTERACQDDISRG